MIRCLGEKNWVDKMDTIAFGLRATYHTAIGKSPAELVFGTKMVLPYINKKVV